MDGEKLWNRKEDRDGVDGKTGRTW